MKKMILVALLLAAVFGNVFASGNKEPSKQSGTNNSATQTAPVEPPKPSNPYFDGDGGISKGIAILAPTGESLSKDETYLPIAAQGNFVTNFTKFSAMSVLDRVSLEKVLAESESGIYSGNADFAQLGEITGKQYVMTGKILKTRSGYSLQMQIADTKSAQTAASYTGTCTVAEIDNYTAVKKASEDLLGQMGVTLTDRGRQELLAINTQAGNAETALARGITAQRSGTTVEALAYYYQAAAFDPSLAEAVSRASVLSADDISSGNIGENARNDIAWRKAWVERLTETENFVGKYIETYNRPSPSYDLVYSTDLQTGAINYVTESMDISFNMELFPTSSVWLDTLKEVISSITKGLNATGRTADWGLRSWSIPIKDYTKNYNIAVQLVNEKGVVIGNQNVAMPYGYDERRIKPFVSKRVTFSAVKADLITDKLTIRIVSVDGIAADAVGRDGHILISTKTDYDQSPRGIAQREEIRDISRFGFSDSERYIRTYNGVDRDIIIPSIIRGLRVFGIDAYAFEEKELSSVTIPDSVYTIAERAFAGNYLTRIAIPNSVKQIDSDAFRGNPLTSVTIPANVSIGRSSRGSGYTSPSFSREFDDAYVKNGKKAGTYKYTTITEKNKRGKIEKTYMGWVYEEQ